MNDIKLFAVDDCTWYAAKTAEEAVQAAMADTGLSREEFSEDIHEISNAMMDKFKFVEEDGKEIGTFREELNRMIAAGEKFPCFFATSEY